MNINKIQKGDELRASNDLAFFSGIRRKKWYKVLDLNLQGGKVQGPHGPRWHYLYKFIEHKSKKSMKNNVRAIITGDGIINTVIGGRPYSIHPESMYYKQAKRALEKKDNTALKKAIDLDSNLRESSKGKVTLKNGVIMYQGAPINNALTARIYNLIRQDFPFEPLLQFLENVLKNPKAQAVADLYVFLEKNTLPITEDGCFLAWKKVRGDYKDIYTGTMDNSPGKKVSMSREKVNDNRNETCSTGLHVCSYSYLSQYGVSGSNTVVLVKVNPKDVVSVPVDYDNAKMRVCEYFVLEEVKEVQKQNDEFANVPVYSTDTEDYGEKRTGQRFWSVRDSSGRFVKKNK